MQRNTIQQGKRHYTVYCLCNALLYLAWLFPPVHRLPWNWLTTLCCSGVMAIHFSCCACVLGTIAWIWFSISRFEVVATAGVVLSEWTLTTTSHILTVGLCARSECIVVITAPDSVSALPSRITTNFMGIVCMCPSGNSARAVTCKMCTPFLVVPSWRRCAWNIKTNQS